jgi:lipoprotein-releasing system permease protein
MLYRKFEIFVANKLIRERKRGRKTRPVVRISVLAIALSCAVMILTAAVVRGFKKEISDKVIGFGSHIQISQYDSRNSYETSPILKNAEIESLVHEDNIAQIQSVVTKAGILKFNTNIQANILKGVGPDYNWAFFNQQLIEGRAFHPDEKNSIVLSSKSAAALNAAVGDEVLLYFIQDPPRVRKLKIVGIYETGFGQFDELIAITDMSMLQKVNDWSEDQISSYEVRVDDFSKLEETNDFIYTSIPHNLNSQSIFEKHPDIFNWLELQDVNFIIILVLMILVSAINAISALIILILEKGSTIGVFKALGSRNASIRRIFIYQGLYLLASGLFWGNLVGIGLAWLQDRFEIIKLPVESYYLSSVPIFIDPVDLGIINGVTILLCFAALILPSQIISRIDVVKVIKFD